MKTIFSFPGKQRTGKRWYRMFFMMLAFSILASCQPRHESTGSGGYEKAIAADVLIAGGGTSGITAALQAARDGAEVVLVEASPWLGGMLTAAGVSATDGNHNLPSGIWGEFREALRDHYGGAGALATGWVSHTLFEPHVGHRIFKEMAEELPNLTLFHGYLIEEVIMTDNRVAGAVFSGKDGRRLRVSATVSIDATDYGDLMALSGAPYFLGLDPQSRTGEEIAPVRGNSIIQDLTYTAILKDFGPDADMTLPRPPNYQPSIFRNACRELSDDPGTFEGVDCDQMLDYARLPNNKFLVNWPNHGNDYYLNVIEKPHHERILLYEEAKNRTRQFIYFLQTEGGYKNLGLADDEFSTDDLFPYIPYHRETRRLDGLAMLTLNEMLDPYETGTRLYRSAIGVGDYPVDHHRELNPSPPSEEMGEGDREPYQFETAYGIFPPIPSFSIPLGSLIPREVDGLIVAEKSISISSIANGASRLQPAVMTIGQAAGAAAAMAAAGGIQPRKLSVRDVQQHLLDHQCWALPYMDTSPDNWHFQPLQRMGLSGVLRGEGIPYLWANQTWIYPDSIMTVGEVAEALVRAVDSGSTSGSTVYELPLFDVQPDARRSGQPALFGEVEQAVRVLADRKSLAKSTRSDFHYPPPPGADEPITRKDFARLVDALLDPFENLPVSMEPAN